MLTPDQLDNWFTYHPPTPETTPKYGAIRAAEQDVHTLLRGLRDEMGAGGKLAPTDCDKVNAVTRALAEVIDANAPDSDDKAAAIRCVRLARNATNEIIMRTFGGASYEEGAFTVAHGEVTKARWQANSAIACGGR